MKKRIKILMIALQHSAKDDRIYYKESLSLVNNGYDVSYLVLADNKGSIKDMSGKTLNLNNENEIYINGIKIIAVRPPQDRLNIILKKIFLGNFQNTFISAIIKERADIYHAHEPISLRFAFKAAKITNKKVVFDSHESWQKGTYKERFIKILYLRKIKYFITVNNLILKELSKNANFSYSEIVYNASLTNLFPFKNIIKRINSPVQLVHEGSLTFDRGLKTMFNSILILKTQFPDINLKIIGNSPKKETQYISNFISKNKLQKNITFTGFVDYEDVYSNLINCDIGLIMYSPTKNNLYSTSNKLFNYIASGLAIISTDYLIETNLILKPLSNSLIIENIDSQKLANSIKKLIENPELLLKMKNSSIRAHQKYNWEHEEEKLLNFYKKVVND